MQVLTLASLCLVCTLLYSLYSFKFNLNRVKRLDIPKVFNPLCPSNVVWVLVQPVILPLIKLLPFSLGRWVRYSKWGWEYEENYRTHAELGDIWMQVTPSMNWVYVADAGLINEIFHRREDFRRPLQLYSMLKIFGANVGTVEGHDWQRHRKITSSAFNEQNYGLVWSESIRQSDGMLQWWTAQGSNPVISTAKDVRTLSLNVLANVGFRKFYPFDAKSEQADTQEALSFRETLCFVLDNALLTLVVPPKLLKLPFLPSRWRQVGRAIESLRTHMMDLYKAEKSSFVGDNSDNGNLMRSMVRASEKATSNESADPEKSLPNPLGPKREGLTKDEIFGNIFVYYFAGHDTTAAVFAYAMYLLAAYPEVQEWIAEELEHVLATTDSSMWRYEELFPKLKRCLAVLLETLRLYDPIPGLPKWTGESDRQIQYNGETLIIPARTFVLPSLMAVHTHPRYWGADSLEFRPERWIVPGSTETGASKFDSETIFTPAKGTYFPWSDGQRNCPGKKFAQVEFVAVVANLFKDHRVYPERQAGEGPQQARQRVLATVKDSQVGLLLQMRDPTRVAVRWEKKSRS